MMNVWTKFSILFLLVCLMLTNSSLCQGQDVINLSGHHPVMSGDNPDYAKPEYDDSGWNLSKLPAAEDWSKLGGDPSQYVRWQRIKFETSKMVDLSRPALLLGVVSGADKVYLNGELIGDTANLDASYVTWQTTNYSQVWTRIYEFDPGLVRYDRSNVLAIRFARFKEGNSSVIAGPMVIADTSVAYELSAGIVSRHTTTAALLMAYDLMVALAVVISFVIGFRNNMYVYATQMYACVFFGMIFLSTLLRKNHIELPPFIEVYLLKFAPCLVAPLTSFVAQTFGKKVPKWAIYLQRTLVISTLAFPVAGLGWLSSILDYSTVFQQISSVGLLALLIYWAFNALRSGNKLGWPLSVGLSMFFVALFYEFFVDWHALVVWLGHPPSYFTFRFFLICLAMMVGQSYLSIRDRLNAAREDILSAHEMERSRLARDIHDGIGQWLSSIKLDLQLFKRSDKTSGSQQELNAVMDHIDEAISDTRRIAHDLSPVMIEKYGFSTAIHNHVDAIAEKLDLAIIINIDETISLNKNTESHLYRIFQEAIKNAIKHGEAKEIKVTLAIENNRIVFEINDNGLGFDVEDNENNVAGLGFTSIKERASLLSADCQIKSKINVGTSIKLLL
jgi:signal transduction histidine kinase